MEIDLLQKNPSTAPTAAARSDAVGPPPPPPESGARVLAGYALLVLGFALAPASLPGRYETQFCDEETNRGCCVGHLGMALGDDPSGQLAAVYAWYGALLLAGGWGAALRFAPGFRSWAWRARPALPRGANYGQAALVAGLAVLHAWWFWWWWQHPGGGPGPFWQTLSKTFGHMNDLDMSLLLLLASRTNVWEAVLGLGWDAGVAWHRAFGTMMVGWTALHVLVWHVQWLAQGIWLEHAVTYSDDPNVLLTNASVSCTFGQTLLATCGNGHFWAIPAAELVTLFCWGPAMYLALRPSVRRAAYERFYYWHHAFLLLIPVAYYHSWHVWQYSYIGVTLWAYNRLLAWRQSQRAATVQSAAALPCGVSHLSLLTPSGGAGPRHRAGQLMYLCVPEIDPWQWHPFTISSSPTSPNPGWEHHIKDMGAGTWTGELYRRLQSSPGDVEGGAPALTVRTHGPYGAPPFGLPAEEDAVLFYVGGIGVTPAASIVSTWLDAVASGVKAPHATFVWAVRDTALLRPFAPMLAALAADTEHFQLRVHCTRSGDSAVAHPALELGEGVIVVDGRPDTASALDTAERHADVGGGVVGVFVCGPAPMVADIREASLARASTRTIHFHAETFEF